MKNSKLLLAALIALLPLVVPVVGVKAAPVAKGKATPSRARADASNPSAPGAAIARVGGGRVEEADIRRAALVMGADPLRTREHAVWRKKLLDLCVDRELLALEAEHGGVDAAAKHEIGLGRADLLYAAIRERYLVPEVTPTPSQIDTARAGGLFRRVQLSYILSVTDKKTTYELFEAIKHGARFDSIAALYSTHSSATRGGEIGWRRVGELNASSWHAFATAKPGDLMGPYPNYTSHEFYRVEAIADPTDNQIRDVMLHDRLLELDSRYQVGLFKKYHFRLNPDQVSSIIFASATERADSILASLDSEGKRPKREVHPSLGVLARVDGDSITYRDLAYYEIPRATTDGKARIEDSRDLLTLCTATVLPRLIERDARERGIEGDAALARRLRLLREGLVTRAMVARAVPAQDSAAVRAYFDAHASRYRRPAARRAFVTMFATQDTAQMARSGWDRRAFRDSILATEGFRALEHGALGTLFPRSYGEISLFDTDTDSLSVTVRSLANGQISPLVALPNGYALAQALGREEARGYTFEEARSNVETDAREDAENRWVVAQLERLRAATPPRAVPGRLDAVRLGLGSDPGGNRR
ncbi:MAG TPA: peptidyl-prolyl cis-trans isomerase [Candidatus Binatia bacterium]|nr:peptidyl-prolyl cis-trans isomerase [Candidatus Binatia bacterium]